MATLRHAAPAALLLAALASCGGSGDEGSGGDRGASRRPNVLLVTLDTTRADRFSCYGWPEETTPHFDALAAEGVRFAMGVTTAGVTPVSHASILTGRFNHEHGLRVMSADHPGCSHMFRLAEDVPSLFPVLQENGWTTAAFQSAFPVSEWFGFRKGFDVFESLSGEMNTHGPRHQWPVGSLQRRSDQTTDLALSFLDRTDGPWAMWVHYWDPHDTDKLPPDVRLPDGLEELPLEQRKQTFRDVYAREVAYVDEQFGRLVEALRARGEWDDTLVAVVCDHGEGLDEHEWWFHRILYQEQIHSPFILRLPGVDGGTAGRVVDPLVRTIDVAPTLLDALGLPALAGGSGRSLVPLVRGEDEAPRIALFDQLNGYDLNAGELLLKGRPQDTWVYGAMDRRWKLLYRPDVPEESELFDLESDPDEAHDLFSFEHPEARRLLIELARAEPWQLEACSVGGQNQAVGALGTLGYTENEPVGAAWRWTSVTDRTWTSDTPRKDPDGEAPLLIGR